LLRLVNHHAFVGFGSSPGCVIVEVSQSAQRCGRPVSDIDGFKERHAMPIEHTARPIDIVERLVASGFETLGSRDGWFFLGHPGDPAKIVSLDTRKTTLSSRELRTIYRIAGWDWPWPTRPQ
jgi:hypothetical protein